MERETLRFQSKEMNTELYTGPLRNKQGFESPCNGYPNLSNLRECSCEIFPVGMRRNNRSSRGWEDYIQIPFRGIVWEKLNHSCTGSFNVSNIKYYSSKHKFDLFIWIFRN